MESTINPYNLLNIVHNSNGTLTRLRSVPDTPATGDIHDESIPVLTKDIPLNPTHKTWLRIFRSNQKPPLNPNKLPLIIYFHGGGFAFYSASSTIFHDFCSSMATQLPALIISVEYRLAPENRLPAAYEDAIEALNWVRTQSLMGLNCENWLFDLGDFSRCFLMGSSAGGNIAYHAGLRAVATVDDLTPVKISGFILHQPFFSGLERTESEMRAINDTRFPLCVNDLLWELGLPIGVDRDHEFCNPTVDGGDVNRVVQIGLRMMERGCLVTVYKGDLLSDRQIEFMKMLEKMGVRVVGQIEDGGFHGVDMLDDEKGRILVMVIKDFIYGTKSSE